MDEAIKQIGERLKGLREVLNIPAEEVAELYEISLDHYLKIESGEADPSVYRLLQYTSYDGIFLFFTCQQAVDDGRSETSLFHGVETLDGTAARSSNLINGGLWVFASLLQ